MKNLAVLFLFLLSGCNAESSVTERMANDFKSAAMTALKNVIKEDIRVESFAIKVFMPRVLVSKDEFQVAFIYMCGIIAKIDDSGDSRHQERIVLRSAYSFKADKNLNRGAVEVILPEQIATRKNFSEDKMIKRCDGNTFYVGKTNYIATTFPYNYFHN